MLLRFLEYILSLGLNVNFCFSMRVRDYGDFGGDDFCCSGLFFIYCKCIVNFIVMCISLKVKFKLNTFFEYFLTFWLLFLLLLHLFWVI